MLLWKKKYIRFIFLCSGEKKKETPKTHFQNHSTELGKGWVYSFNKSRSYSIFISLPLNMWPDCACSMPSGQACGLSLFFFSIFYYWKFYSCSASRDWWLQCPLLPNHTAFLSVRPRNPGFPFGISKWILHRQNKFRGLKMKLIFWTFPSSCFIHLGGPDHSHSPANQKYENHPVG